MSRLRARPRGVALALVLLCGAVLLGVVAPRLHRPAAGPAPAGPRLRVLRTVVWYSTTPGPGVWAELQLVLDNPLALDAQRTVLRLPPGVLDDFALRGTEPALLAPPRLEPDGSCTLLYPPPLDRSENWYRVFLVGRRASPRPLRVAVAVEGPQSSPGRPGSDVVLPPVAATTRYVDRAADPFLVVPEQLVGWVPWQSTAVLPLAAIAVVLLGGLAAAGCGAAFWLQRR